MICSPLRQQADTPHGIVDHGFQVVHYAAGFNPLRPNNDLSQTSHYNIKGVSVSEVMRIENKITPVKFY